MQYHLNGVSVNDMPKFLLKNLIVNNHTVIIQSDIDDSPLLIPLMHQCVTSYFLVKASTMSELKVTYHPKISLNC